MNPQIILTWLTVVATSFSAASVFAMGILSVDNFTDGIQESNLQLSQKSDVELDRSQNTMLKNNTPMDRRRRNFNRNKGLSGIRDLLEISKPTNQENIYRIELEINSINTNDLESKKKLFVTTVIDEFIDAVDLSSLNFTPEQAANLDLVNQGIEIKLKEGGALKLVIRDNLGDESKPAVADLRFVGFRVPGYEKLNRLEFRMKEATN